MVLVTDTTQLIRRVLPKCHRTALAEALVDTPAQTPGLVIAAGTLNLFPGYTTVCADLPFYSKYNYCGKSEAYCGVGCNPLFGKCSTRPSSTLATSVRCSSSAPSPSSTQKVSTNARCGHLFNNKTCLGSMWGDCCSKNSYWWVVQA